MLAVQVQNSELTIQPFKFPQNGKIIVPLNPDTTIVFVNIELVLDHLKSSLLLHPIMHEQPLTTGHVSTIKWQANPCYMASARSASQLLAITQTCPTFASRSAVAPVD